MTNQCAVLLFSFKQISPEDTQYGFFFSIRLLVFTHSILFQCIWNFQSFQFWYYICSFLFISSSFSCDFLLRFGFVRGGIFSFNLFMYHSPPISCNILWRISFKLIVLGSLTGIIWNIHDIVSEFRLECSRELCSQNFSQQSMKLMVAQSETYSSAVEFDGHSLTPPLLPSSIDDGCFYHVHQ